MSDDIDTIEMFESEVDRLVDVGHRQGLNYWQILKVFLVRCVTLQMQADVEYRVKGGT